jgi:hypothetical protein
MYTVMLVCRRRAHATGTVFLYHDMNRKLRSYVAVLPYTAVSSYMNKRPRSGFEPFIELR